MQPSGWLWGGSGAARREPSRYTDNTKDTNKLGNLLKIRDQTSEKENNVLDTFLEYLWIKNRSRRLFFSFSRTLWVRLVCLPQFTAVQMFLNSLLVVITDLAAALLGNSLFRRHFHLFLSAMIMFGPLLNLWVSHYSVFAKRSHYLYRIFLRSGWGWTCIFVGSFIFLLSLSVRRSLTLTLQHLSRLAVAGGLWLGFRKLLSLLENATGSCYEPLNGAPELAVGANGEGQPLLLLREGETKTVCISTGMLWRGYEVSEDIFLLCFCCLLLAEETAVFGPYLNLGGISGAPLRILFLFCVLLLSLWLFLLFCLLAYFPQFPNQLLGGALGCLSWRAMYQGWYHMGPSWYCPGRPGVGLMTT